MFSVNHQKIMEMDELSLRKVPYFFVIDFLSENVEVYKENEIEKSGLKIDFQEFSTLKTNTHSIKSRMEIISRNTGKLSDRF